MSAEIMIGGLPTKVYKKLEHVNVQYEEKLAQIEKRFEKKTLKISEDMLNEIEFLKIEK